MAYRWTCPFCNHDTTINVSDSSEDVSQLTLDNKDGTRDLLVQWIVCPNKDCVKLSLSIYLFENNYEYQHWKRGIMLKHWNLIPQSSAIIYPDYIPKPIKEDYEEACAIKELSPKASATLSRRCVQGMIRDFYGIKKKTLFEEIDAIKEKVDPLTWKSIDGTRKIGNIGAHMEKDINLIIDVNPKEAQALINLVEILVKDWYINRHERELTLKNIVDIADEKSEKKKIQVVKKEV